MNNGKRILVVVDPTRQDEQASVTRAHWLAEKLSLGIELLACYYEQSLTGDHFVDSPGLRNARREVVSRNSDLLEKIAEPLRKDGIFVEVSAIWDRPLDEGIIRHVLRTKPELVLKETHHDPSIGRALFSNTDWNLVRLCPTPLWLAKANSWPGNATILASLDPVHENDEYSELDQQILNLATLLEEKTGSDLHAFHSFVSLASIPIMPLDAQVIPIDSVREEIQADHQKRLDLLLKHYEIADKNVHLMSGHPEHLLPDLAKKLDAGLVVMGSIARNALKRVFIGSTTERVLGKLPCDLLVVKPEWFVTPVATESRDYFAA